MPLNALETIDHLPDLLRKRVSGAIDFCDLRLLFIVTLLFGGGGSSIGLLCGLLLLLLVGLLCRCLSNGLLQDLEDFLVLNLLLRLVLGEVNRRGLS